MTTLAASSLRRRASGLTALLAAAAMAFAGAAAIPRAAQAAELDLSADEALVVDMQTGAELLSKNPDQPAPPASMLKLMTLTMVFEALRDGRLSLDDEFLVSEKAWRMGGSKMFVEVGQRVPIEDLIRGVIVLSGNDACIVLAEGLAGSEEAFARQMTERAKELGMKGSNFVNATGWPAPGNHMSPRDLVFLASRMIKEFPDYYKYFAETDFEWGGVAQRNRNPLLYANLGADGLKTGHTEEAGYGLVGSAVQDGRRIVFMFGGTASMRDRAQEAERLVNWAFREFRNEKLYAAGQSLGEADVWMGSSSKVGLTVADDVLATLPYAARDGLTATISYSSPIEAPIEKGQQIADLVIQAPEIPAIRVPVVAAEAVPRGGYLSRVQAAASLLARDALGGIMGDENGDEPAESGS